MQQWCDTFPNARASRNLRWPKRCLCARTPSLIENSTYYMNIFFLVTTLPGQGRNIDDPSKQVICWVVDHSQEGLDAAVSHSRSGRGWVDLEQDWQQELGQFSRQPQVFLLLLHFLALLLRLGLGRAAGGQVWSLNQLYSIVFSKSRTHSCLRM